MGNENREAQDGQGGGRMKKGNNERDFLMEGVIMGLGKKTRW